MASNQTSFKKGQGGRKPGSKNRATSNLRQFISEFLHANKDKLQADFEKLKPVERMAIYEKLLKYSIPTLQSNLVKLNVEEMTEEQLDYLIDRIKGGDQA